jgi:hypothetical protein
VTKENRGNFMGNPKEEEINKDKRLKKRDNRTKKQGT